MTTIPELYAKIEAFLAERVLSNDGDFAPVSDEDMHALWDIAHAIISAKWEPDADNDYPVEMLFVDRNERESFPYAPVTYRSVNRERSFRDIVFNLRAAIRDVTLSLDLDEIEERSA